MYICSPSHTHTHILHLNVGACIVKNVGACIVFSFYRYFDFSMASSLVFLWVPECANEESLHFCMFNVTFVGGFFFFFFLFCFDLLQCVFFILLHFCFNLLFSIGSLFSNCLLDTERGWIHVGMEIKCKREGWKDLKLWSGYCIWGGKKAIFNKIGEKNCFLNLFILIEVI